MKRFAFANGSMVLAALVLALAASSASAQSRVQFGRITNVTAVSQTSAASANVGTLVGGAAGLATGRGQSRSNQALRAATGAAAGRGLGSIAGRSQAFEYTVLIDGTSTIRIISDQAGKRVGDCVAVEQGQFSNIRLVDDARCVPGPGAQAAVASANACEQAKQQALEAATDEAFALAERRIRLLCGE